MATGIDSVREEHSERSAIGGVEAVNAKPRAGIGTPQAISYTSDKSEQEAQGAATGAAEAGGARESSEAPGNPTEPEEAAVSKEGERGQDGLKEKAAGRGEEVSMGGGGAEMLDLGSSSDPSSGTAPVFGSASSADSFLEASRRGRGEEGEREDATSGVKGKGGGSGRAPVLPDDCLLTILECMPGTRDRNSFALASRHCWELEAGSRTRLRLGPGLHPATQALGRLADRFPALQSIHFDYLGWKSSAGPQLGDDALRLLVLRCTALTDLSLSFCGFVTDTGMAYLGNCPTLRSLRLNFTPCVTGRGLLSVVLGCPRLEALHVERCMGLRSSEWLEALGSAQSLTGSNSTSNSNTDTISNSTESSNGVGAGRLGRGTGGGGGPPIAASAPTSPLPSLTLSPLPAPALPAPLPAASLQSQNAVASQQGSSHRVSQGAGVGLETTGAEERQGPWLPPAHPRLTRSTSGGSGGQRWSFDESTLPATGPRPLLNPSGESRVVEGPVSVYMTPTHVVASPMEASIPPLSATSAGARSGSPGSSVASSLGSPLPGLPSMNSPQTPPTLELSPVVHPGGAGGGHSYLSPSPLLLTPPAPTALPMGSPMVYPASAAWRRASAALRQAVGVKRLTIANCRGIGEGDLARLGRAGWERLEELRFEMDLHPRDQLLPSTAAFNAFASDLDLRRLKVLSLSHCPRMRSEGLALVLARLSALHSQTPPHHPTLGSPAALGSSGTPSRETHSGLGLRSIGAKGEGVPGESAWGLTELRLVSCPGLNDADVRHLLSSFSSSLRVLSLSLVKWLGGTAAHAPAVAHPAPVRASAATAAGPQGPTAAAAAAAGLAREEAPSVPFPAPLTPTEQAQAQAQAQGQGRGQANAQGQARGQAQRQGQGQAQAQGPAQGPAQGQGQGQGQGGAAQAHQESTWAVTTASLWYVGEFCRGLEELELICRDDFPSSAPLFHGFADAAVSEMVANLPALRRLKVGKGLHLSEGLLAQLRKDHPNMTLQLV